MNSFEAMSGGSGPQHFAMDGQGFRAPRLRVPDPGSWKMDVLKNKDDGFHAWRENFELQVGSVWLALKPLFEVLQDTKVTSAQRPALGRASRFKAAGPASATWVERS